MEELLQIYDKVMELKIFVDSADNDLLEKYNEAVKLHNEKLLKNKDYFDAGFDLYLPDTTNFNNQQINKVDHNIICSAKMYTESNKIYNTGYYLYPRSSNSKTPLRLANSTGIIDAGYRGHIIGMFDSINRDTNYNLSLDKFTRLLQICGPNLCPILVIRVDRIEDLGVQTVRGSGGFGSTGK